MKQVRFIAGFALAGFLVSFFFGFFSRGGIGRILLFAFIFAAVFVLVGFVVQFIGTTFLNIDASAGGAGASAHGTTGGNVDIVVQDEELPTEDGSPEFYVGENHQMLNKEDYSGGEKEGRFAGASDGTIDTIYASDGGDSPNGRADQSDDGFVPVQLYENARTVSGKEAGSDSDDGFSLKDDTLDDLPDLEDLTPSGEIVEDTVFSAASDKPKKSDKASKYSEKDTTLMAKAISTALAKDNET
ncbi:hypothetical protein HMPREF1221_00666 [Treponema socranskii subsp. paredis ATCC 35535]|nr:hypothetical protein HMPREF1221_00666 [Treponema socranskii subsp. paredis ATCC 35535]